MANYGLRYLIEYTDLQNNEYKCELLLKGYQGEPTSIEGNVILNHKAVDSVFTAIRSTSLKINIYASIEQPLDDFNVIEEFSFQCKFYRNDLQIFLGWINPDGIFQDYVQNVWQVSLTAVDGLGSLKNLEFTPRVLGGNPVAPQEGMYLFAILVRLNYLLNFAFYDDLNVQFTVNNPNYNQFFTLSQRVINENVFRNKNGRFLSCEVVLNDILSKYNLSIVQQNINGQLVWLIARSPFMLFGGARKGIVYNLTSIDTTATPYTLVGLTPYGFFNKPTTTIYSDGQTSDDLPIHCNSNQQFTFEPALQNFRFTQDWLGLVNQNRPAPEFWTVTDRGEFVDNGIRVDITGGFIQIAAEQIAGTFYGQEEDAIPIIEFDIVTRNNGTIITNPSNRSVNLQRILAFSTEGEPDIWLNINDGNRVLSWGDSIDNVYGEPIYVANGTEWRQTIRFECPPLNNRVIRIFLMESTRTFPANNEDWEIVYERINVFFQNDSYGNGVFHDAKRLQFRSTFLKEPVKVINSNDTSGLFLNNLLGSLGAPMNQFFATNTPIFEDLLELTAKERLRLLQKPQRIFRGDVYGFVPYFTLLNYSGFEGLFLIREYIFNTAENIVTIEAQQIHNDEISIDYEKTFIFENETNVLIQS